MNQLLALQAQGPDLSGSIQRGMAMKDASELSQRRNALLDVQIADAAQTRSDRQTRREALPGALAGDKADMAKVGGVDPGLFLQLDERQRQTMLRQADMTARLMMGVEQLPEDQRPAAWAGVRSRIGDMGGNLAAFPEQYDQNFARRTVSEAMSVKDQFDAQKGVALRPGGRLVNPRSGDTMAEVPGEEKGFTLGPGQVRYGADGKQITQGPPRPPVRRNRQDGNDNVVEEYDPQAGWYEVSRGPRFAPRNAGPNASQAANNQEIDAARNSLKGLSPQDIAAASQRTDPITYMPNPKYDPRIARLSHIATQRKTGVDDPAFETSWGGVYGPGQGNGGGGLHPPAGAGNPIGPQPQPKFDPMPRGLDGRLDAGRLQVGQKYEGPDGPYAWDGKQFQPVE